jgi:uncharacterized oligopeptide transporter (OPT) family protein
MVHALGGLTFRSIILSISLAVLFSFINGYLGINFGMGFGFGAVAIAIAYTLLHKLGGGSSRRELSIVLIASSSNMAIYYTIGFIIYLMERGAVFPCWLAPSMNSIVNRFVDFNSLIPPIIFFSIGTLISCVGGLIFAYAFRDIFVSDRRMVWPHTAVVANLVDACLRGGAYVRIVGWSALIGFIVTFLQYLPLFWGYDFTTINLTPILPYGMIMALSLNLSFLAIGYIINADVSLSLMLSGMITYLVLSPILALRGVFKPSMDPMASYNSLLFAFSISPSLGILLLGGGVLSLLVFVRGFKSRGNVKSDERRVGYLQLYKILLSFLLRSKRFLTIFVVTFLLALLMAWVLNPLSPLPPYISTIFAAYMFLLGGFIECIVMARMSGETGMSMGMMGILLYDLPIFGLGYRDYPAYLASGFFKPVSGIIEGTVSYYKYADKFDVSWSDIVKAKIVGWIPTFISSIILVLVLWIYLGFGTPLMPAISFIQGRAYYSMLVSGNISAVIDPVTFICGGILGALLELFTPISMFGVAMGMLLPPHYIIPMGIGGLIRWYTDRRFGKEFFRDKGSMVATGIMATSIITQVLMSIITKIF